MEATALSVGKSVLDGALGYATSAVAEEVALQLGIQRDHAFIRDELAMMQAFLRAAHNERDHHEVLMTWVKQVRDVAYDAEDSLQDFSIHLRKPSWWRLPSTLKERRRIAKRMKELRAKVEDVSQRNLRYQLIKSSSSKLTTSFEQPNIAAIFGIDDARRAAKQDNTKSDLVHLIHQEGEDLRVIAVWGTSGDLGQASIINEAYENPDIKKKFPCRAWVRVLHPLNPVDYIQSMVKQFQSAEGIDILLEAEKTREELAEQFKGYVNQKSYLIVLNGLSTFEEWRAIRTCFPNNKKGSQIVVCTPQAEVASLCVGKETQVLELKQISAHQTIYALYEKDPQHLVKLPTPMSEATGVPTNDIPGNQSKSGGQKTVIRVLEESRLIGREKEKSDILKLISGTEDLSVISVWGMGGLGKTTLVKDVYQSQQLIGMFEKRACVTVMRPFFLKELLGNLVMQINAESFGKAATSTTELWRGPRQNTIAMMGVDELVKELDSHVNGKRCLIVLDDLSSTAEWDQITKSFVLKLGPSSRIVVTTREESIARHCSEKQDNIYKLKLLKYKDALDLFTNKVFKEAVDLEKHPELIEEAKLILKKCNGLPLAIVTIGGFLSSQRKTAMEWRKMNEHISAELEMNPELEVIRTILSKSYDGLPYDLKACFLYLSIFPEDQKVNRRRLTRRWAAEGYTREVRGKSTEEIADDCFMKLIDRSMILPSQESIHTRKGIDSCQVHDLMREICISKSMEENLVFILEEGCSLITKGTARHLAISRNWNGGRTEFDDIVNGSSIRSLTVFGKWRPFFISEKMRMLRVLDLEGTLGLNDHHLEHIGKFLHLKYLCLRGCKDITHLPYSLGNLRQLETLDIKHTAIIKLPKVIFRLRKLQYLRCGGLGLFDGRPYQEFLEEQPKLVQNRPCLLALFLCLCCVVCCRPQMEGARFKIWENDSDPNRHDVCNAFCCSTFPFVMRRLDARGVVVPSGVNKLNALHTLGTINIGQGKTVVLGQVRRLTGLRKFGVVGVNKGNREQLCMTLSALSNLESLSVRSVGEPGLEGCLEFDGLLYQPPRNLRSLKLEGNLVKLPGWISGLQNLVKLTLIRSKILDPKATMRVLGNLPNLNILRLQQDSFHGKERSLTFNGDEPLFRSLKVLQLNNTDTDADTLELVEFTEGSMPMLELLLFRGSYRTRISLSGPSSLPRLRELLLEGYYKTGALDDLREQLAKNPNKPVLKMG